MLPAEKFAGDNRMLQNILPLALLWAVLASNLAVAEDPLVALGKNARDTKQAEKIVRELLGQANIDLPSVLAAMKSTDSLGKNYYLSVAQVLADRDPPKTVQQCKLLLSQLDQDPVARYWAFSYVTEYEPGLREQLLEEMLTDTCPELRFEAIELQLKRLESAESSLSKQKDYASLLDAARLPEQIEKIAKKLLESGGQVDLLKHFCFIPNWHTVGPFNNEGQKGFDVAYPPEQAYLAGKLNGQKLIEQKYDGKESNLSWVPISTDKPDGKVELNEAYNKAKGAIVYALGEFRAEKAGTAELRIGSPNAVKVWVNGQQVESREVYHAGGQIDQYIAPIDLRPGANSILVKVCQNEQTEPWAQDWYFQVRISDSTGAGIASK
jgi:hypothetical protein